MNKRFLYSHNKRRELRNLSHATLNQNEDMKGKPCGSVSEYPVTTLLGGSWRRRVFVHLVVVCLERSPQQMSLFSGTENIRGLSASRLLWSPEQPWYLSADGEKLQPSMTKSYNLIRLSHKAALFSPGLVCDPSCHRVNQHLQKYFTS